LAGKSDDSVQRQAIVGEWEAVLIVVVVRDRNHDGARAQRLFDFGERKAAAHVGQLDGGTSHAFDDVDDRRG
jgi:hypothetical protein